MHSQETKLNGRPTLVNTYDSIAEITRVVRELAEGNEEAKRIHLDDEWVGRRIEKNWDGDRGLSTYVNTGWDDGLKIIDEMMRDLSDAVTQKPKTRRRRRRWSDEGGDDVCYDRLRAGQDRFWVDREKRECSGPGTATVLVNISAHSVWKSKDILWRGAAALCITELLTNAGFNVEVVVGCVSEGCYTDGTDAFTAVTVKQASDRIDRSTLTNAVSGWFFRSVGFASWQYESSGRTTSSGLGRAGKLSDDAIEVMTGDERAVIVEEVKTREDAIEVVRQALADMKVL